MSKSSKTALKAVVCTLLLAAVSIKLSLLQKSGYKTVPVKTEFNPVYTPSEDKGNQKSVGKKVVLVSKTSQFKPGYDAEISFKGEPDTVYSISVYFSTGKSTASAFSPKTSDANGNFSWKWKMSANVRTGSFRIVVTSENSFDEFNFEII